jgi:hypothetical protein
MIRKKELYNVECDHCGALMDDEMWRKKEEACEVMLDVYGWMKLGGRHYCEKCWMRVEHDDIVTSDGRKWTKDGDEIMNWNLCQN